MTAAHSSGPWAVDDTYAGQSLKLRIVCPQGEAVADVWGCDDEARANARLIAAAPELLAHLKYAVKLLEALPGFRGTAQVDAMQAAIAKARGVA